MHIAEELLRIQAVELRPKSPFTWSSGIQSPIYCDNRLALSHPNVRSLIVDQFVELFAQQFSSEGSVDYIAGVATAGIPHGTLLADRLDLPFIYVRSKQKSHGRQNLIEGAWKKAANVLVIEDLISTGGSSLQAIQALREVDMEVVGLMAIFTYGFQKAVDNFHAASCPFYTLTNYQELIKIATRKGFIQPDEEQILLEWREDPENWSV